MDVDDGADFDYALDNAAIDRHLVCVRAFIRVANVFIMDRDKQKQKKKTFFSITISTPKSILYCNTFCVAENE